MWDLWGILMNNNKKEKKKKRKKQNYFDNQMVEGLILRYKKTNCSDPKLLKEIMEHLDKIIIAIINKYRFYNYYEYDDLIQEARIACIESLSRFDMNKVKQKKKSVFSYFSNVVKRNLRFFTLNKNKKIYRETAVPPEYLKGNGSKYDDDILFTGIVKFNDLILTFKNLFKEKKRMYNLVVILEKYIKEISGINFKTKDFIAYCKSFGYTPEYVKKFLSILREHKEEILNE